MATLLEKVAEARDTLRTAEATFERALRAARRSHSWQQIADVAGLKPSGVRYIVEKGEKNGSE